MVVSCDPYYFNNDGDPDNGCEYECEFAIASEEVCDDADNDCDGATDEDFDKQNDPNKLRQLQQHVWLELRRALLLWQLQHQRFG